MVRSSAKNNFMETRQKKETRIEMAEERFILPLLYQEKIPLEAAMWEAVGEPVATGWPRGSSAPLSGA